jgi:hypothetical protein
MDNKNPPTKSEKLSPAQLLERHRYKGKLTPMFREKAIDMVRRGAPPRTALKALGCTQQTIRNWEEWAETGEVGGGRYAAFLRELREAEQLGLVRVAENASRLTEKDGRVALDYLGRRDPDHWAKRDEVQVNVAVDPGPVLQAIVAAQQKLLNTEYKLLPDGNPEPSLPVPQEQKV